MKLDELHVHQPGAGFVGQRRPIAGVLVVTRGVAVVEAGVASRRQHHHVRPENEKLARVEVHASRAEHPAAVGQQPADEDVLSVRYRQRLCLRDQRVQQRLPGVVAGEGGASERLGAEVALVDVAVLGAAERHPPVVQLPEQPRHPPGNGFHLSGIVEEVPLLEGVRGVNGPVVLRVVGAYGAVDTAACPRGVGVAVAPFADHQQFLGIDPLIDELDSGPGTRGPRADHQHAQLDRLVGWFGRRTIGSLIGISHTLMRGRTVINPSRPRMAFSTSRGSLRKIYGLRNQENCRQPTAPGRGCGATPSAGFKTLRGVGQA